MKKGIKHLIECHCTLAIYKGRDVPQTYHKFPVYSKFDKFENIIEKVVQCNNCQVLHKIVDLCKSEILGGKDELIISLSIDDLSMQLTTKLSNILIQNNCDKSTFEHVIDILDEERWGEIIILKRQIIDDKQHIKTLEILSADRIKIANNVIEDEIIIQESV
jgi:hypothetical protein